MNDPQKTRSLAPALVVAVLVAGGVAAFLLLNDEPRPPAADPAPASAASAAPASAAVSAAPTTRRAPLPLKLTPPPALLKKASDAPLEASRGGVATAVGRMIRLDVGQDVIGDAKQICLTDEAGGTDTCAVLGGWPTKRVLCARAHADVPLKGALRWQVPCP